MKLRVPNSVEDAVTQAAALLGKGVIAAALSTRTRTISESLVSSWGDPEREHRICLADALAIDGLLLKTGHAKIFGEMFEALEPPAAFAEEPVRPLIAASRIVCSAADVLEEIEKAEDDGHIDSAELINLLAALDRLQKRIAPLRRALFARVKSRVMAAGESLKGVLMGEKRHQRKRR